MGGHSPEEAPLPPGQFAGRAHVRFGLGRFRHKRLDPDAISAVRWTAEDGWERILPPEFPDLERIEQVSDFHCVTTWSIRGVTWSGRRFRDVFEAVTADGGPRPDAVRFVVFNGFDGYRSILALEDLLADDVLLADRIDGCPLGLEHGGPLRLVAPAHYGYKSVKHLHRIALRTSRRGYRFPLPYPGLMDHPRARVALEERAVGLPNWLVRFFYKLFVPRAVR
jgi:DMSO/TMAO reductase YedYZ molybdopterin-dependent catalytic subunit